MIKQKKLTIIILYAFIILLFVDCNTNTNGTETKSTAQMANDSLSKVPGESSPQAANEITESYTQAIAEYLKAMYKKDNAVPDTLFIGKNPDFPDIKLPATILKTNIMLLTGEEAEEKLHRRKPMVYLNIMGWVQSDKSEFIIVTFFEGGKPQHNCHIYFTHNSANNEFKLDSLKFEYQYTNNTPK